MTIGARVGLLCGELETFTCLGVARADQKSDFILKWSFVAPTLVFLIALNVFPLFYNVILSFTNANLSSETYRFVGGQNYARIFSNPVYAQSIRTTGLFVFLAVTVELILGFMLALSLKQAFVGKTVVLTILLVPMMLSPAVMGLYWNLILNGSYGVLNQLLGALQCICLQRPQWTTDQNFKADRDSCWWMCVDVDAVHDADRAGGIERDPELHL